MRKIKSIPTIQICINKMPSKKQMIKGEAFAGIFILNQQIVSFESFLLLQKQAFHKKTQLMQKDRSSRPIRIRNSEIMKQREQRSSTKSVHFAQNIAKTTSMNKKHRSSSILKKSSSVSPFQSYKVRSDSVNSMGGKPSKEDQCCENVPFNNVVKEQYVKLLKCYSLESKYTDEAFPPSVSSLFSFANRKANKQCRIKWKRLSQLFGNRDMIMLGTDLYRSMIRTSSQLGSEYIALTFNCVKNNRNLVKKIVENQKPNKEGIYCLKIFQTNAWKYIIIDDYIPVIEESDKKSVRYRPAFITVEMGSKTEPIQIWPFLLEKAYAKFYSSYQTLRTGNVFDFLQQISNQNFEEIKVQSEDANLKQLLKQPQIMVIGEEKTGTYTSIFTKVGLSQKIMYISNSRPGYKNIVYPDELRKNFNYIYIYGGKKHPYVGNCPIRQIKESISMRCFYLKQPAKTTITLTQKDERFFKGKIKYCYSWIRLVLLEKEAHEGYRWIDGKYENWKSVTLDFDLEAGEYHILIIPEWEFRPFDLSLFIHTKVPTTLERKPYIEGSFEDGCADLAQRFGKMNQLNPYICSYNCIHEDLGLIIENINNEKTKGMIRIKRSINGLQSKLPIEPFNREFKGKEELEISIKNGCHYTVVLAQKGGIDRAFFQNFYFNSQ